MSDTVFVTYHFSILDVYLFYLYVVLPAVMLTAQLHCAEVPGGKTALHFEQVQGWQAETEVLEKLYFQGPGVQTSG